MAITHWWNMSLSAGNSLDALVGQRIKQLRLAAQCSEVQVAARLGMPLADYRAIEAGQKRATAHTLHAIAVILKTTLSQIYSDVIRQAARQSRQ